MRSVLGVCLLVLLASSAGAADQAESTYSRGLVAYHAGEYAQAISMFDAVLQAEPQQAGALYYRGLANARLAHYEAARSDLEAAAKVQPSLPVAANLGVIEFESGHLAEARKWLDKAVTEKPSSGSARLLLGIIAYQEGDFVAAESHFAAAETADPSLASSVAYYRGIIATKQDRRDRARAEFKKAATSSDPSIASAASGYLQSLREGPASAPAGQPRPIAPRLSLGAYAGFEYDSNLVLQDIPVSGNKGDGRFIFGLGGNYRAIDTRQFRWDIGYDFYQSLHFDRTDFNLQGHRLHSSLEYGDGPIVPGIEGQYAFYLLEDKTYSQEILGSPFVLIDEMGFGEADLYYRIRGRDFLSKPFNPARDGINHAVGLRQVFFLGSADRTFDVGYQFDREDPESHLSGRDFDYRGNQVDAGISWPIPGIAGVELRYGFRNEDYLHGNSRSVPQLVTLPDGTVEQLRLRRRDDMHWVSLILTRNLTERIYARLGYLGEFNNSNIVNGNGQEIFGYDRHIVSATLGVNF